MNKVIFGAWCRGWALTRQVSPPISYRDGLHIEVGQPQHAARYLFPNASPTLRELGATISEPWVFLKAAVEADELRALLPSNWAMQADGFLMVCGDAPFPVSGTVESQGYALEVIDDGARTGRAEVRVLAADGATVAASGHLALDTRLAIYDRIVTEPAHQRRGLGRVVMRTLQTIAHRHSRHGGVLVATPQGRGLYESLGWRLHAPWATAVNSEAAGTS